MLEKYFVDREVIERVRHSWLAEPIKIYLDWLSVRGYCRSTVRRRVYLVEQFSDFVRTTGAKDWFILAQHVMPFAEQRVKQRNRSATRKRAAEREICEPIFQMLRLLPGCGSQLGKAGGKKRVIPFPSSL